LGPAHPLLAMSINNLASTRLDLGDYDEARDLFEESLTMRRELLGPDHPNVGIATSNMAAALSRMGHLEEAEELYVDATRILVGALGTEHPAIATVTGNHAALFHRQGQHDRALPLYRRALEIRRAKLAEGHFLTASLVSDLGRCLAEFGSYVEAEQLLLEARDLLAPQQDMQARRWKDVHSRLAEFYDARGRTAAAERFRALSDGP
jgi:tetratricopeptide (TPR) repeat protein